MCVSCVLHSCVCVCVCVCVSQVLTQRVEDLQQQIGTLQKQLMKAMKDAAAANKPSVPGAG